MGFLTTGNDGFDSSNHLYQDARIISKIDHQAEIREFNRTQRSRKIKGIMLAIFLLIFNCTVVGLIFLLLK